jgi:GntR family transcriptional repressor for pyruvate dehydrogenase complex
MFERLHSEKNYMQIAKQVRALILEGALKIGDKLPPERVLVEQFGASRASIREALSALEMLGLIECRSGQGNYIKADGSTGTIDGELFKALLRDHPPYDICEARLELEPSLTALAALRASDSEREKLKSHVKRLRALRDTIGREANKERLIDEYMEEDRKYHLEIARCAHNEVLFTVFSGVNLMLKETHWKGMKSKALADERNLQAYETEHEAILSAIVSKDAKAANREARKHLVMLKKTLF